MTNRGNTIIEFAPCVDFSRVFRVCGLRDRWRFEIVQSRVTDSGM